MFARILFVIGVLIGGGALWSGLDYYVLPVQQRPFSPLHELYAPTGLVGHGFGIIGTLMVVAGVLLYMARKRFRFLGRFGKLRDWLHFHIFLCLLGPFLVLLHTTFKFGGIVAISFWSMAAVVSSGVFGRWVYVWIPKTMNGRFLGIQESQERVQASIDSVRKRINLSPERWRDIVGVQASGGGESPGIVRAVARSVFFRMTAGRERARVGKRLAAAGVAEPALTTIVNGLLRERRSRLEVELMQPFQRAFRYWHAFHLPLAIVMFLVLIVHVGVAVAFGYTWIF